VGAAPNQAQARLRNALPPPTVGADEQEIWWAQQPNGLSIEIGVPSARQYLVRNLNEKVIVSKVDVDFFVQQGKAKLSPLVLVT
jgi:hypothetical protein